MTGVFFRTAAASDWRNAVTGSDGEFALEGVPPGRYTLQIWQESLGTVTKEVVVPESGAATATVEMGKK